MCKRSLKMPIIVLIAVSSLLIGQGPARSTDHLDRPYDWTIEVQTQQLARRFDYPGSTLTSIVKAVIRYYPTADEGNRTDYESIWYNDGKALGLERLHGMGITQGEGVSLRIVPKTGHSSQQECKAAADLILRLTLDAYVNRNAMVTVRLADESFDRIIEEMLRNPHITRPTGGAEDPADAALSLFLQSESSDRREQLFYI